MNDLDTYAKDMTPVRLLGDAINIYANGEAVHDQLSLYTHMWGLQGQKRYNSHNSKCDRNKRRQLQHYCIDVFGEIVEPTWNYEMSISKDTKEYFQKCLEWEISVYTKLNNIINSLVTGGYNNEACLIRDDLPCIAKKTEKFRRWINDFEKANWSWEYIRIVDTKLHDKLKAEYGEE